jgi:uncharacterized repeat protein (TIGR03833 family)
MVLVYESSPGYYYIVKNGEEKKSKDKKKKSKDKKKKKKEGKGKKKEDRTVVQRISREEYDQSVNKYNYKRDSIKVGDKVTIIIKPYKDGNYVTGRIKKILTKKRVHTRGHKVMLKDGTIGRMVRKEK